MSHICIVLPHIRNLIKTPEDWLITFLRINYSVSVSQIPARWWRGTGGPAGGQFREASLVSHTVVAHSRTLWWHCSGTQWRTLVAHSGGSTVRPQRAICLFSPTSVFLFSASFSNLLVCKPAWCLVYQTSVSNWCLVYQTLHLRCQTASSFKESQSARFRRLSCKSLLLQRVKGSSRTFKTPKCKLDLRSGCKFQPEETHKCGDI